MKLATFSAGGEAELGIVEGQNIISISRAAPALPQDMLGLVANWNRIEPEIRQIGQRRAHVHNLSDIHLHAPIRRPGKILAIGLNYADHIEETKQQRPENQIWFS